MTSLAFSTLQDFPWAASIAAIKASERCESYDDFYRSMLEQLPQNSPETRRRYAELIQRRFFSDRSLDALLPAAWRAYHDDHILTDLMRVTALEAEPVVAQFVLNHLLIQAPGSLLETIAIKPFVQGIYGEFKAKSAERLVLTCQRLGFLGRYNGRVLVEHLTPSPNALLILLHDRLAATPRIVRMSEILGSQWWRFMGFREPDAVRQILRDAESAGAVARYTKVDELEQITTRYSRNEYLSQAIRL
jgi:hypothetical protein